MKHLVKIVLILGTFFMLSCMDMYNELADEFEGYDYFLAITQSTVGGKTLIYSISDSGLIGSETGNASYNLTPGSGTPGSLTVHPTGKYLYVSYTDQLYIEVYEITAGGGLNFLQSAGPLANNPSSIKVHPSGNYLYCSITSNSTIAMFSINNNGTLTSLGTPVSSIRSTYGDNPTRLAIAPDGDYLYAVASDSIVGYIINNNGTLPSIPSYEFHGTYNDGSNNYTPNFSSLNIAIDSSGRVFSFGKDTGRPMAYSCLIGFSKSLVLIDINATSTATGRTFGTWTYNESITMHPAQNILYAAYRLSTGGYSGNQYYSFSINPDGTTDQLGTVFNISGANMSKFIISPNGEHMYESSQSDGGVKAIAIAENGSILALDQTITIVNSLDITLIRMKK